MSPTATVADMRSQAVTRPPNVPASLRNLTSLFDVARMFRAANGLQAFCHRRGTVHDVSWTILRSRPSEGSLLRPVASRGSSHVVARKGFMPTGYVKTLPHHMPNRSFIVERLAELVGPDHSGPHDNIKRTIMATAKKAPAKKTSTKKTAARKAPAKKAAPKDATALLISDHKLVASLFEQFEKTRSDARKAAIVAQICKELTVHTQLEEEIFYPAVKAALKDHELVPEANVEHGAVKDLIAAVEGKAPYGEVYDAKVKVMGEFVKHHVKEEQNEMFPKARKTKLDMVALGVRMAARKQELMAARG